MERSASFRCISWQICSKTSDGRKDLYDTQKQKSTAEIVVDVVAYFSTSLGPLKKLENYDVRHKQRLSSLNYWQIVLLILLPTAWFFGGVAGWGCRATRDSYPEDTLISSVSEASCLGKMTKTLHETFKLQPGLST